MPDSPEVQQNFNAPVYGVAGKVAGDQIIYASPQKQDLAEAAAEIQRLLKQLEERGWVEVIGHRETVGRPALYATTRQFLDDLGVESLDQLPVLSSGEGEGAMLEQIEFGLSDSAAAVEAADAADSAQNLLIPKDEPLEHAPIESVAKEAPDAVQKDEFPAGQPPLAS
jgi:segregation and condensation protein B